MKGFKYVRVIVTALLVVVFISGGCGKTRRKGKVLTIAIDRTIHTLDPAMHRLREVEAVIRNICDGLVTRNNDMKVVNELVESWKLVDKNTWKFKLKEGVKFHNGDELTAEDVKFTIERIIKPGAVAGQSSPRKGLLGEVSGVKVIDKYSFLIKTAKPYPILISMLPFQEIVPENYIKKVGDTHFAENPVGTGPFRFIKWKKGENIVLDRFSGYYGGSPKLDRIIFKPIPEVSSRISALLSGDVDIITNIPPHSVDVIKKDPNCSVVSCDGTRSYFLGMNCSIKPFSDRKVRLAFNLAIDLKSIINKILGEYATVLAGPLVPKAFGFNDKLKRYEYAPEKAVKLLKEAGFQDGFEIELDAEENDKDIAEAIASQLEEIGIRTKVRVWRWDVLYTQLKNKRRKLFITHWGNASLDPAGIIVPIFRSKGRGNFMVYSNKKVDELIDKSQVSFDMKIRKKCFIEIQRILHNDVPCIFGYAKREIYGVRNRVKNWKPRSDGMLHMHKVDVN